MRETSGQPIPPQSFFLNTVTSTLSSTIRLCLNQGTAELRAALARRETGDLLGGGLGDFLVGLSEDKLNVAGLGLVGVNTTVSCHFVSKNWARDSGDQGITNRDMCGVFGQELGLLEFGSR